MYATQAQWDALAEDALARGIFQEVAEHEVFRRPSGELVLNGAMGVDKYKEVGGAVRHLLRFITILTPINQHLQAVPGDACLLPYIGHALLLILGDTEEAIADSEDFESCFNLFAMPPAWRGFLAFEKKVPAGVHGRTQPFRVGLRTVPMGWLSAVDVIQHVVRKLVYQEAEVPTATEIAKGRLFPPGPDYSMVYLDSFDLLRVRAAHDIHQVLHTESESHQRFVAVCENTPFLSMKASVSLGSIAPLCREANLMVNAVYWPTLGQGVAIFCV